MVLLTDINHFEDMDEYLSSISQILYTTTESIEFSAYGCMVTTKGYFLSDLNSRIMSLPVYSMCITYRFDGAVEVICQKIIGMIHTNENPLEATVVIHE